MKRVFIILLGLILIVLVSCEDSSGKGNLRIILEIPTRSIRPDNKSSTVVKYNVRGVGPGGKTFSRDSASKSISIDGLPMGSWTVTASGYNSESVTILSGSKTFNFDNTVKSVYIDMSSYSGSGALSLNLTWNENISNPKLVTTLESKDYSNSNTYSCSDGTSTYTYSASNLNSGTYLFTVKLYSNTTFVAGYVENLQVINNRTTSGDISLQAPSHSSNDIVYDSELGGKFTVDNSYSLPTSVIALKQYEVSFVPDKSDVVIDWYMDGVSIGSDCQSVSITPKAGDHIINVILENNSQIGSASYRFSAKTNAKKGSAILSAELEPDSTDLILGYDTLIGTLPDNHFIVITPERSSMQVFTVYKNTVTLSANTTYNAADTRFSWLPQATAIYSDPAMNFFVVQTGQNAVHVLYFNPKTEKIDVALWNDEPLSFSDYVKFPPAFIDNVTTISLVPTSDKAGMIFFFDSGSRSAELLSLLTTGNEIKSLATSVIDSSGKPFTCSDGYNDVICTMNGNNELIFANLKNGATFSAWTAFSDKTLSTVVSFRFLNSRYALFATVDNLRMYEYYPKNKIWVARTTINEIPDCVAASDDGAYIYLTTAGGGLLSYRSGLTDSLSKLYSQTTSGYISSFVINNKSIIGLDEDGGLYIFDIVQEDSTI